MNKQPISALQPNQQFRIGPGKTSPVYVRMTDEKKGQIGYRHLITDFTDKPHYYAMPTLMVYPVQ